MSDQKLPQGFIPTDDTSEIDKILREGARSIAAAMIWTKDQGYVINTHLCAFDDVGRVFYAWPPKTFEPSKFMDALAKSGLEDCFVNVALAKANVFMKAKFLSIDDPGIKFAVPNQVFKVQRRRAVRFLIPEGYVVRAGFEDPIFPEVQTTKKIVDISAGGCAIAVGMEEKEVFQREIILNKFNFSIRGKLIECKAQVKHTRDSVLPGNKPIVKVGLQFLELHPTDSQAIAAYVFEETRKFYTRFM